MVSLVQMQRVDALLNEGYLVAGTTAAMGGPTILCAPNGLYHQVDATGTVLLFTGNFHDQNQKLVAVQNGNIVGLQG